jgi:fumarate reductase subunit D
MSATSVWRRVRAVVLILLAVLLAAGLFQTYAWSRQIVERAQTTVSRIVGRS